MTASHLAHEIFVVHLLIGEGVMFWILLRYLAGDVAKIIRGEATLNGKAYFRVLASIALAPFIWPYWLWKAL